MRGEPEATVFPPIPYRPFATRMVLRAVIIWIGIHASVNSVSEGIVLEWQAAALVVLIAGGLAYTDGVRCREPIFLGNCGVPQTSLMLFTFGAAFVLEVSLYIGYATWTIF